MAFQKPGRIANEAVWFRTTAGISPWIPFGPARGRGMFIVADFSGTTNGCRVRVQGSMTSASTADGFLIAQRLSSAGSNGIQLASTSGATAKAVRFVRCISSGVYSATKTARVRLISLPVSS